MKKLVLMLAVLMTATSALLLASCSSDDEPTTKEYIYSAGISQFSGSALNEMTKVMDIYDKALTAAFGPHDGSFAVKGSEKECDEKVRKACEAAQAEIEREEWKITFTYTATQLNNEKVVYKYSYPSK